MFSRNKYFFKLIAVLLFLFTMNLSVSGHAFANIIKQVETPDQILYQARNRLVDNQGNSWQVILFKRLEQGKTTALNLRLVGFPDVINFEHPQDLLVLTLNKEDIKAKDKFAENAPSENVGEYDFKGILSNLQDETSIILSLPLQNQLLSLKIPYPVMLEWQEISKKTK